MPIWFYSHRKPGLFLVLMWIISRSVSYRLPQHLETSDIWIISILLLFCLCALPPFYNSIQNHCPTGDTPNVLNDS